MGEYESNPKRWRREKSREYILIETRPAKSAANPPAAVTLDWLPGGTSGACAAFQALQRAVLRCKAEDTAAALYAALHTFAEAWQGDDPERGQ